MTPYRWLYLCSDPRRLAITLRTLPQGEGDRFVELESMTVLYCSHLDPAGRRAELRDAASQWAPSWLNIRLTDASPYGECLPDGVLKQYFNHTKKRWGLGMKLAMPWMADGHPYLYTDDDVLIPKDPIALVRQAGTEGGFGTSGNFKFFKGKSRLQHIVDDLRAAFDLPDGFDMDRYDRYILDAGIWFDAAPMTGPWSERLKRFGDCPYLQQVDEDTHEFRRIDQRFLTCYGYRRGWQCLQRSHQRRNCYSHPTKFHMTSLTKGSHFVHYKTGQHKANWMTALEQALDEGLLCLSTGS